MPERDPYEVLGLAPGATKAEIRKAYRRMAKRYHPDANSGDAATADRFIEVQRAYEFLVGKPALERARRHDTPVADEDPFLRLWAAYVARRRSEAPPSSGRRDSAGPTGTSDRP